MANRSRGRWVFPVVCLITAVGLVAAARNAQPLGVWIFVAVLGGWVVTLCLHEFAHSVLALAGGDSSVRASDANRVLPDARGDERKRHVEPHQMS